MEKWKGRLCVVTGASEGIGEAVVRRLAERGMKIAALARRSNLLEALERDISTNTGVTVRGYRCDVTCRDEVLAAFQQLEKDLGPVSAIVNNAGVLKETVLNADLDLDNAKSVLDVNLMGVLNCTKAAMESMKRNNITDGHIINISSRGAYLDTNLKPELATYYASKTALNILTKSIKYQLNKDKSKIRVSTVSPGWVETSMTVDYLKSGTISALSPRDVADCVEFALAAPSHVNIREILVEPL